MFYKRLIQFLTRKTGNHRKSWSH